MIDVHALSKRFGALQVLHGLDLRILPGRVTAVIGPNGSGKTTLIKSILGLAKPDQGEIRFGGVPVDGAGAYRARIGYMPQLAPFPENLTAAEVLRMLQDLRGVEGRDPCAVDEELGERFAIAPQLHKPLGILSGGTRQKVNAMCAFLFRPELLILDEPTAGLDPVSSGILKDKILRERAQGRTFILTSHIVSELEELVDDVAFLLDGTVHFTGSIAQLRRATGQERLERAIASVMTRGVSREAVA
ncbi:MAG TPA: ABC transporter ATP-binding protein [Gemmatimonadaceae bacterium]|nr:ABC transporter ATP-binding protein [Gemmatimonadaceae bacterium]